MSRILGARPSAAMWVAFIALGVALSGTAVALPGSNTVDSGDIRNNTVRSKDLRNNDVRGRDIRTGTVRSSDVRNDGLTGADIVESSLGEVPRATRADTAGTATNAASLGGEPAGDYLNDIRMVTETSASNSTSPKTVAADCAAGEEILGGGANIAGGTAPENIVLQDSHPDQSDPGDALDNWVAVAVETDADAGNWTLTTYALCAEG